MRIRACHYQTGEPVELTCAGSRISSLASPSAQAPDLEASWVAPALFDLQVNGCNGLGFHSPNLTGDMVRDVVRACRGYGVGSLCPTVVTNSQENLVHGLAVLNHACETDPEVAAAVPAIHLEGPYISAEDGPRGAHPREHVRPPDWEEFRRLQDAAGGRIRLVTLAPEHEGALPFIEQLVESKIVVALGHTGAPGVRIREAIAAGARLSTHLGNGSHALLPRHENYIWEQLAADDLWASIICDGHHLPPAVVRCILRVKTPGRTILISDAGSLAGLPPGRYQDWGREFEVVAPGKIVVPGSEYLAGSWAFLDSCVGNAIRFARVSLGEAVDMASVRPRELLGLPPRRLLPGEPADLVLFDWSDQGDFRVTETIIGGKVDSSGRPGLLETCTGPIG